MTNETHPTCNKCNNKGYIDTFGDLSPAGDVFICSCECVSLAKLESEAIARLRTTNKVRTGIYLSLIHIYKAVEVGKKVEQHESKADYWNRKANDINLSMPESLEYYELKLEEAKAKHEGLKNGTIERSHSFSLTYANKDVKELEKKIKLAQRLWA